MNKKELRDRFYKEHTYKCENGIPRVATHPHNLFEWMYEQLTIPVVVGRSEQLNALKKWHLHNFGNTPISIDELNEYIESI